MIAVALCVVLMIVFPGVSLALIFSPLWVTLAIGLVVVLFLSKK